MILEKGLKVIATQTAKSTFDYLAERVKARVERSWKLMSEYMNEKVNQGETFRNDWCADNEISNNRLLFRLLEKTIKDIINDSEERKSQHIAKFWVNICLTSNSDIDEATAFSYLETIESLSWRQLCIIRLIILCKSEEVYYRSIQQDDVNQMPQDDQTSFYSITRDYVELVDNHYIDQSRIPSPEYDVPFLRLLKVVHIPNYTYRLHSLMNLDEIPIKKIVETFSIWNVKPKE